MSQSLIKDVARQPVQQRPLRSQDPCASALPDTRRDQTRPRLSRRSRPARRRTAPRGIPGRPASPRAAPPCGRRWCGRAAGRAPRPETAGSGRARPSRSASSASPEAIASARAQLAADRESLEIPGDVLAEVDHAALLAEPVGQQLGVPVHRRARPRSRPGRLGVPLAREGRGQVAEQPRPAEAARGPPPPRRSRSAATIRTASAASQMSPLPSTGMSSRLRQLGDRLPVGLAAVEVGRGPAVQRDVGHPGVLGPQPGLAVGQVVGIHPSRIFTVTGSCPAAGPHRRAARCRRTG